MSTRPAPRRPVLPARRLLAVISTLSSGVAGLLFLLMTGLVVMQVFFRYLLNQPLTGSEEAARIAMIYVVLLGAGLCMRSDGHMAVTYFRDLAPPRIAKVLDAIVLCGVITFALILIVKGYEFSQRAMFQTTPALQIPKGYVTWAFPLGGFLIILFALESFLSKLTGVSRIQEKEASR